MDDNSSGTDRLETSLSAKVNQTTSKRLRDRLPFMNYLSDKQGSGSPDAHPKALPGDHEKADGAVDDLAPALRAQTDVPDEVKAVVAEVDDPNTPCETVRAYFLGVVFAAVGTALNTWFGSRQPGIYISPLVAQFVSHPFGLALAYILPSRYFSIFGFRFTLNPGKWTVKEHCIVTLMSTVSLPTATAIDIVIAISNRNFFNDPEKGRNYGFQFLVILSTQFLGFGIAGLAREILVYPSSMIWPLNLAKVSLFNALHRRRVDEAGEVQVESAAGGAMEDHKVNGWKISMFRFCLYAAIASFCWLFLTAFIAPFLTFFNWPTWIAPTNRKLSIIMGSLSGLGLNPMPTFDWTYVSGAGLTPLITPWWATLQIFIGAVLGLLIIIGIYFSNTWYTAYMLPNSNAAFDRFGAAYNVSAVLTPQKTLDEAAYKAYSPLYYSAGYNLVFGAYFAQYTAVLVYTVLEHGSQIKAGLTVGASQFMSNFRRKAEAVEESNVLEHDAHYQIMKSNYKEVKQWWFAIVALIAIVMGIIMVEVYDTTMPVWGIFLCLVLAFIFLVPAGIIYAVSNIQITLVVLAEIIPGVAIPGRPYANMIFKIYGWVALIQALLYVQDQKLAHYLHLPPRATFRAQMAGCLVGSFITLGIINWQMNVVPDLCTPGQKDLLTCPYYTTFFSSALLFGVIGPTRVYGANGLYKNLMWAFFVGAALSVVAWAVKRKWPNRITNSVNVPVIIAGAQYFAPYNFSYVWSGVPLAWLFMKHIYTKFPAWWKKYCYVLSIGFTVGASLSGIIQFFAITYPGAAANFVWWGRTFYATTCDGVGCPLKDMPAQGYFGPGPGEF